MHGREGLAECHALEEFLGLLRALHLPYLQTCTISSLPQRCVDTEWCLGWPINGSVWRRLCLIFVYNICFYHISDECISYLCFTLSLFTLSYFVVFWGSSDSAPRSACPSFPSFWLPSPAGVSRNIYYCLYNIWESYNLHTLFSVMSTAFRCTSLKSHVTNSDDKIPT